MNLQYKWDVYLITAWFTTPGYWATGLVHSFMTKYKLEESDLVGLKRIPGDKYVHRRLRVQPFICTCLVPISNVLWKSTIEDVFDIATKLSNSALDCAASTDGYRLSNKDGVEIISSRRKFKRSQIKGKYIASKMDECKSSFQWGITK